ncbi:Site-specific DNA recombinase [Arthrobacter alpinus]|uniref:Site-specific DNA recombinase n=1 Tax=Arthrobacter alpinus TaxID=656366 RepID=A0A1H5EC09_9MICC|nr:recombinase family protein [Arthrobacter alpinus]SED88635.1 Site-specific DNA recombinase [Arthrobacter alpinus]
MSLIGYARVSTADQSLDLQIDALEAAGCTKIFREKKAGSGVDRPELKACMEYLREGDTLAVYKLDRLGRSLSHLLGVIEALNAGGIQFKSISDALDTTSPSGKLMFSVVGSFAQFEKELNRERTMAGLVSARERGRMGGRPKAVDAEIGAQIVSMREAKRTVVSIAKELGVGEATVYRHMKTHREAQALATA